jgi:hypothetical protein
MREDSPELSGTESASQNFKLVANHRKGLETVCREFNWRPGIRKANEMHEHEVVGLPSGVAFCGKL